MTTDPLPITTQLRFNATELSVRSALIDLRAALAATEDPDTVGSVEIVVAEVLNNIVEHACAGRPDAVIQLDLTRDTAQIFVQLRDPGAALPGGTLPSGQSANVDVERQELPEGGFGWGLIHALTDRLDYRRIGEVNHLKLWFIRDQDEP